MHARQQIRAAAATVLTGLTATGPRVYVGRTRQLGANHQPAILIYTSEEIASRDANGNPPILARPVTLHVEIRVNAADPPDDALDAIAVDVEAALAADRSLGNRLRNMQFIGSQMVTEAVGLRHVGGLRLDYRLTYRTPEGVATAIV